MKETYIFGLAAAFAFGLCLHVVPAVNADIVSLEPAKDNSLLESSTGTLSNGKGDLYAGQNSAEHLKRALLAFDLTEISPQSTINSAELTLTVIRAHASGDKLMSLHRVLTDWGEADSFYDGGSGTAAQPGDATWIHASYPDQQWTNPGGDFLETVSASQMVGPEEYAYTWNSTALLIADVQHWVDNPEANFGWILIGEEGGDFSSKRFFSREAASDRPVLTIDYTVIPEPSTLAMLMAGAVLAIWLRRRRPA